MPLSSLTIRQKFPLELRVLNPQPNRALKRSRMLLWFGLFLAPLAFGSVEPWAWNTLGIISCASILIFSVYAIRATVQVTISPLLLPVFGLILLGIAQILL